MRYFTLIIIALSFMFQSCKDNSEEALKYNRKIIEENRKIAEEHKNLEEAYNSSDVPNIKARWKKAILQCEKSIAQLAVIGEFDGDASLKNAADRYFKSLKRVLEKEHSEIIRIIENLTLENINSEETEFYDILKEIQEKETESYNMFLSAQKSFAEKHNIKLDENEK